MSRSKTNSNFFFALVASLTLGLAPFFPEPHLVGKLRWIAGGGEGMVATDYFDLLMHGIPWVLLIYYSIKIIKHKTAQSNMKLLTILENPEVKIIDVREISEYNQGSLPNAIHMPLSQFGRYIPKIRKMKGPKVLFCRSGNRSGQAVSALHANGIMDSYNGGGLRQMESYKIPV